MREIDDLAGLTAVAAVAHVRMAGTEPTRIYGAGNIERYIKTQKSDFKGAKGSIADHDHSHNREVARRLKQEARRAAKAKGTN